MPQLQSEFLDWLLDDDKDPPNQTRWASQHGVNARTVREWKQDARFRAEWDRRASEKNVSTERVQAILDVLWVAATEDHKVEAAKLWLEHSRALRPPAKPVSEGDYAQLSDEELVAQMAEAMNFGGAQ